MKKLVLLSLIMSASLISAQASETELGENRASQCVEQDQSNRGVKADTEVQTRGTQESSGVKVEDKG